MNSKVKPYTFNAQPFLVDKNSAMQGYVTSEPFAVERQGGFKPVVFLLADHGFDAYSTLIETRRDLVETKPNLVQRFVDASAIGWYHYIYGDSRPGNELIKKQNPEMTDALLAYSIAKMKEYMADVDADAVGEQGGVLEKAVPKTPVEAVMPAASAIRTSRPNRVRATRLVRSACISGSVQ